MAHFSKHIVAGLLIGVAVLGGASLVEGHSKDKNWWSHGQFNIPTRSLCAYECALKNHDVIGYNTHLGACGCKF